MSSQDESRESSYDPSVSNIENRVYIYNPTSEGYRAGLLDDEDDDDMDYMPAEESLDEEAEDMDENAFEGAPTLLHPRRLVFARLHSSKTNNTDQ